MITARNLVKIAAISGALWLSGKYLNKLPEIPISFTDASAGKMSAQAFVTVPALLQSKAKDGIPSTVIMKIWRQVYEAGHGHSPQIAIFTSAGFGFLGWSAHSSARASRTPTLFYTAASLLVVGIIPFTLVFMRPVNQECAARAAKNDVPESLTPSSEHHKCDLSEQRATEDILASWARMAGVRSMLPLAGGLLGLLATAER